MNNDIENHMVLPYHDDDPIPERREPEYDKDLDADDGQGRSDCLLGPRVDNWARNVVAIASWRERMRALGSGATEPDLRNADQRLRGAAISIRLHVRRQQLRRTT